MTITHGRVKACGHRARFSVTQPPKGNCVECYKAYFMTCCDLDSIHVILTKQGVKALERIHGRKFVRMFHGFLRLLPALNAEANAVTAEITEPVKIEGGAFGDSTAGSKVQATIGVE